MLRPLNDYLGFTIHATDGDLGHCSDVLVDDESWTIRYLVVSTTRWLPGRKIVLAPVFLDEPDQERKRFLVRLTRQQIEESPPLDEHAPLSRQYEINYHEHFTLPFYWIGENRLESSPDAQGVIHPVPDEPSVSELNVISGDEQGHLRSAREITGYRVFSDNGTVSRLEIGHVEDFVIDDEAWQMRYLIVDTGAWLPGRKILLSTRWLSSIRWIDRAVHARVKIDAIQHSPIYDSSQGVTRTYESILHDYYRQPYYWT